MKNRLVFMGSPAFSVSILRKLAEHYLVVGVVTQPDRPAGRGKLLTSPPVKVLANEIGLPVIQPDRLLKNDAAIRQIIEWSPDAIVVAAYGKILRHPLLSLAYYGCINVHASLLPRWRGASPIQAAIANGDAETGVTIMQMDEGLDTGLILAQTEAEILPQDTAGVLETRLSAIGAELIITTLVKIFSGSIIPRPQDNRLQTYAPLLKKEDGKLDFSLSAEVLSRRVRAYNPWPGAFFFVNSTMIKVYKAHEIVQPDAIPRKLAVIDGYPVVGTTQGWLTLDEVKPAGKNVLDGKVFLSGYRNWKQFCDP